MHRSCTLVCIRLVGPSTESPLSRVQVRRCIEHVRVVGSHCFEFVCAGSHGARVTNIVGSSSSMYRPCPCRRIPLPRIGLCRVSLNQSHLYRRLRTQGRLYRDSSVRCYPYRVARVRDSWYLVSRNWSRLYRIPRVLARLLYRVQLYRNHLYRVSRVRNVSTVSTIPPDSRPVYRIALSISSVPGLVRLESTLSGSTDRTLSCRLSLRPGERYRCFGDVQIGFTNESVLVYSVLGILAVALHTLPNRFFDQVRIVIAVKYSSSRKITDKVYFNRCVYDKCRYTHAPRSLLHATVKKITIKLRLFE